MRWRWRRFDDEPVKRDRDLGIGDWRSVGRSGGMRGAIPDDPNS